MIHLDDVSEHISVTNAHAHIDRVHKRADDRSGDSRHVRTYGRIIHVRTYCLNSRRDSRFDINSAGLLGVSF